MSSENAEGTTHTLTRAQVAERLGISTSSVRRLEWDKLQPVQDERGVHRFDPAEVDALAPRPHRNRVVATATDRITKANGRLAATIFRMFARRLTLAQIVVATKQPPERVREFYREWSTSLEEAEYERRLSQGG
jgi:hypothetical protein